MNTENQTATVEKLRAEKAELMEIARALVAFANSNNSINLRGELARAVGLAREALEARPKLYAVETATAGDWADCWSENDEPMRFNSRESAEQAIAEHLSDAADAVKLGHMECGYTREDFRIVEVSQ